MAIFAKLYRAQLLYSAQLYNAHKTKQFTQNFQRPAKHTLMAVLFATLCACTPNDATQGTSQAQDSAKTSEVTELLNVSYDVSRDFYKEYNPLFVEHYKQIDPKLALDIQQSHGGSSKQALSVKNGLEADVVTMNQGSDIELLSDAHLVNANWRQSLPNNAIPFTSTIVFIVREGNPKHINDWGDLIEPDVELIIANPKTTGNGRYAFLGAYGYALKQFNQDTTKTQQFVKSLLGNVKVFENGGRAATTTFAQRQIGDVLITFENEAHTIKQKFGNVQIIYPSYTINAENPVAVVDTISNKKGTTPIAHEYLSYLYSKPAQELAVKYHLRPSDEQLLAKHQDKFPPIQTFFASDVFGDWQTIMTTYFKEGGIYDQLSINTAQSTAP